MIILLIYVVSYVPFAICFVESDPNEMSGAQIFDLCVDGFFLCDIIIQFISAYENPINGLPVVDLKKIAINYLKGWFLIDLVATIPVQLVESMFQGGDNLKMVRLARLPRLYRMIRILRMLKMLRVFRKQ